MNPNIIEGFFAVLDDTNKIKKLYQTNSNKMLKENKSLFEYVDPSYEKYLQVFLNEIKEKSISFNHRILLLDKNKAMPFFLNGYKSQTHMYVFGIQDQNHVDEILQDLISFNNSNINELRLLRKQIQLNDSGVYNEITKLNNDLLNSRRLIEKQNSELKRYNDLLKKLAIIDSLTGAYNRRHFYDIIKEQIIPGHQYKSICLVVIDFNDFKLVNDTFGHDAGDKILVDFVQIAKEVLKDVGNVFRMGGDEFTLLLYDQTVEQTQAYMVKLAKKFQKISPIAKIAYGSVCIDTSQLTNDFQLAGYFKIADKAMYLNKAEMKKIKSLLK
jgi:diguanylate cyclase (GGDEF)-like protein